MAARPLVMPEIFNGDSSWDQWIYHFENVAVVNDWDEDARLRWLKVRLTGRAQSALQRLQDAVLADYTNVKKALQERFEPSCRKERYQAQFQTRKKKKEEGWADFADSLRTLVDKAYPDLEDNAKEQLALNHFVSQIENCQVAFSVRQKRPKTVDEAVSATLEMEAYIDAKTISSVVEVEDVTTDPLAVNGVTSAMADLMKQCIDRLEKLEMKMLELRSTRAHCPFLSSSTAPGKRETLGGISQSAEGRVVALNDRANIVISTVPHESFCLYGFVNGVRVRFLVDTGASVSLLHSDVWHRISASHAALQPWSGPRLVGVDGSELRVCGYVKLALKIGTASVSTPVVVVDTLTAEGILGMDFLRHHQCNINIPDNSLTLSQLGITVPLQTPTTKTYSVSLIDNIHIPPRCEMETMATSEAITNQHRLWLLEGQSSIQSLVVARAVVEPTGSRFPVRLLNFSDLPCTLHQGTRIGILQQLHESQVHVSAVTPTETSSIDPAQPASVSGEKQKILKQLLNASGSTLLTEDQKEAFKSLVLQYADIFFCREDNLGRTSKLCHSIDTGSAPPIRQLVRRIPPAQRTLVKDLLDDMLHKDIIQPSQSPWASPIVLARKKDGSVRFCADYRKVNEVTRKDAYPLPRINGTLETLSDSKIFSTLDLASGYWQRLMDIVLTGLQWTSCLVYLDDIIVLGRTFTEHLSNLGSVFSRIRDAGLKIKPEKCSFLKEKVKYLGHIVSKEGIAADPEKTATVKTWPTPTRTKEVQQFLGLANYYRRFIKDFAQIAKPLHKLTERTSSFLWTTECQKSFEILRHLLSSPPILSYPDFTKPFILDTDASNDGIGGVLSQLDKDGERACGCICAEEILNNQREDQDLKTVIEAKMTQTHPPNPKPKTGQCLEQRRLLQLWDHLLLRNGLLYCKCIDRKHPSRVQYQLVVPPKLRSQVLKEIHEGAMGGHLGEEKTLQKLKDRFYWPGHWKSVQEWCHTCPACSQRKTPTPKNLAPLQSVTVSSPMQMVAIDILGPLPVTLAGNKYILVAADYFSKWIEAYAIPNQEATTIAHKLLDEMFCRFALPEKLHSDQGRQFEAEQEQFAEAYEKVRQNVSQKQCYQSQQYNRRIHGKPFDKSELVWLFNPAIKKGQSRKFHRPWGGPYRICEKLSDVTYCVQHTGNNKCKVVHFNRLKKCPENVRLLPRKPTTGAHDPPPQPVSPPPVGSSLELLEDDDVDQGVVNPVPNGHPPAAQPNGRYPVRARRPPDRFQS
eukprot:Em0003g1155a